MIHLSARLAWHDSGWNGCVCKFPHLNSSCIANENIRDERDDDKEREFAGTHINQLDGWKPPCSRDILTYSTEGMSFTHRDPLHRRFLGPVDEEIPPYTVLPAPYRWLREETFRDVCEAEGLSIRLSDNPDKEKGWVYEPDRQTALLNHYWGRVKEGEGQALIFFYTKENPVDEDSPRLVTGVGRLKKVGPQLFFDGTDSEQGYQYPIWTRAITQDYPNQGFRLPFQEYIDLDLDPKRIACYVPKESIIQFSFVSEHITDDQAVGVLERLIQSVNIVYQDNKVPGPWKKHLEWLDECLEEVWFGRGPYPGIGPVLKYLGFKQGMSFHRVDLKDFVKEGKDSWQYVRAILEGKHPAPTKYYQSFKDAQIKWRALGRKPIRLDLIDTLVKFELSSDQIGRIMNPDDRKNSGIIASEEELINNPYIICESDLGSVTSDPISLDTVDRGMLPESQFYQGQIDIKPIQQDDTRRVRAVANSVLKEAADEGDTLLSLTELFDRIRNRFPERRGCRPDREIFEAESEFHEELLWLFFKNEPKLVALKYMQELESEITSLIKRRVKRTNSLPNSPIDWDAALCEEFGEPSTEREKAAHKEKISALKTLYKQRISVLTGSAGTGKTSAIKVFLDGLEKSEGNLSVRLLAPTGKARVRLSSKTKRKSFTIHQFLLGQNWFMPEIFVLKLQGGGQVAPSTVIIDESSMVSTDLMGILLRAIMTDMVKRIIFVGDPNLDKPEPKR